MNFKKILLSLITIILIGVMCGCGKVEIDINSMASTIKEQVKFEDDMQKVSSDIVSTAYELDSEGVKIISYLGSGATAEEITVFECKDSNKCNEVYKIVKKHIEQQKKDFKSYNPKELDKLNNSVIVIDDRYIILCVTNDFENAQNVINDNLE